MGLAGWLTIYARDTIVSRKGIEDFGHAFVSFRPDSGEGVDDLKPDCGCTSYGLYIQVRVMVLFKISFLLLVKIPDCRIETTRMT